jgi:TatD DNase family protein
VFAAHPVRQHFDDEACASIKTWAADPLCVAIGECGLDFNRNFSPPDVQEVVFARQVQLAEELGLPLFMHSRDASPRFFEILK